MLARLMGFDYRDPRSLEEWGIHHSMDHDEIRQGVQNAGKGTLFQYVLYPVKWSDWKAFSLRHQSAHNEMNAALGLEGADLQEVNFENPREYEEWIYNHFREHQAARASLAI